MALIRANSQQFTQNGAFKPKLPTSWWIAVATAYSHFFFFLHLDVVDKTGRFCADWWNWCQRGGAWNLFRNFKLVEDFLRILFRFIKQCRHDDDNIAGHLLLRLGLVWTNHLIGLRQVRASELADSGRLKPKRADNFRRESLRYGRALFWRSYTWK